MFAGRVLILNISSLCRSQFVIQCFFWEESHCAYSFISAWLWGLYYTLFSSFFHATWFFLSFFCGQRQRWTLFSFVTGRPVVLSFYNNPSPLKKWFDGSWIESGVVKIWFFWVGTLLGSYIWGCKGKWDWVQHVEHSDIYPLPVLRWPRR